jgi:hypothetical protein
MRKALVVGIDYYDSIVPLFGCVNDAHSVKAVLERNSDGTVNFEVKPPSEPTQLPCDPQGAKGLHSRTILG